MEKNKQSISELEKKLVSSIKDLEKANCIFGERLLIDATNSDVNDGSVQQSDVSTWQELKDKRHAITDKILRIKQITDRLDELKEFLSTANKKVKEQEKILLKTQTDFVMEFYKNFKSENLSCFQSLFDGKPKIQSELDKAENRLEQINKEMKEASVFQKIGLTAKKVNAQAKHKIAMTNMKKLFEENSQVVFDNSDFKNAVDSKEDLPKELSEMQHEILTILTVKKEAGLKADSLLDEKNKLNSELESLEAKDNPKKQISAFTKIMQECDQSTDELYKRVGENYVNTFFDDAGMKNSEQEISENSQYYDELKEISEQRIEVQKIRYLIEYLKTQKNISSKEKEIETNNKKIEKYKDTIEKQNDLIEMSKKEIEKAEKDKAELVKLANELEGKI